jgi:single-stranded-DNA-specific exonuclease
VNRNVRNKLATWQVAQVDRAAVLKVTQALDLHPLAATRLVELGMDTPDKARLFLHGSIQCLPEPEMMLGVNTAVDRLAIAVNKKEPVLIYGDYDADGVTATSVLISCLRSLGVPAQYYIPNRLTEGYGLHTAPLEIWAKQGGTLVISVDCGSNDFERLEQSRQLGLDMVITDHHEVMVGERPVTAFINPKQQNCPYPDKYLAGVGVAWNLARALYRRLHCEDKESDYLIQMAALGTIADVVPLVGANRIIVQEGLKKMSLNPLPGLKKLVALAGISDETFTATQVAFTLAPRLNAAGRLGDASQAVELLLSESDQEIHGLAQSLNEANLARQNLEANILKQARQLAITRADDPALVLWHEDWHPGVVGIVAGKLAKEYARPVVLVAVTQGEGLGSARSIPGFDLINCLRENAAYLTRFGGHKLAAGLTIPADNLPSFREHFCITAGSYEQEIPPYTATALVDASDLTLEVARQLALLQPFGEANQEPVFLMRDMEVQSTRLVGKQQNHLQATLLKDGNKLAAVQFNIDNEKYIPVLGHHLDALFQIREDTWRDRSSVKLRFVETRPSVVPSSHVSVIDCRNNVARQHYLDKLAKGQRLAVWVNTKAAATAIGDQYGGQVEPLHCGRGTLREPFEALVFYHLPFDQRSLELVLSKIVFCGQPRFYLLFDSNDQALNERIFATGLPAPELLQSLAGKLNQTADISENLSQAGSGFPYPVTRKLLERSLQVLRELGKLPAHQKVHTAYLEQSSTYREGQQVLADFRRFQQYFLAASCNDITIYLTDPENYVFPEEAKTDESGKIKGAN